MSDNSNKKNKNKSSVTKQLLIFQKVEFKINCFIMLKKNLIF